MAGQTPYAVRPGGPEDLEFMWDMLYEAACWRPDQKPPKEEVLSEPHNALYLKGWGRPGDAAVVALDSNEDHRAGAAWYRLTAPEPGYGFVDASTPEITVAVDIDHRGCGVGMMLLDALLNRASTEGFEALSLSVERDNWRALSLYEKSGFVKLFPAGNTWTMKADLRSWRGAARRKDV